MNSRSWFVVTNRIVVALLILISFSGCVPWSKGLPTVGEYMEDWRDYRWGASAYSKRYGVTSRPFKCGFIEGYHGVIRGGNGCAPVLPPKCYWNRGRVCSSTNTAASNWFEGFEAGAAAAQEDGLEGFVRVQLHSNYSNENIESEIIFDPTPAINSTLSTGLNLEHFIQWWQSG